MKLKRKAQGMSVNVIIVAAIALIVLVVLVAVFTGKFGQFVGGVDDATNCEQACNARGFTDGSAGDGDDCEPKERLFGYSYDGENACCCSGKP